MYLQHFGLTRYPFGKTIATEELFVSAPVQEIEARLDHWLELRSIALVTGEVGSGKTTLCRRFAFRLHPGLHRLFYVCHSTGNPTDLYKLIAWELRLPVERNRAALYRSIQGEVTRLISECRVVPLLIIDEAQNLRNDVLEDLRLLTNYAMDSENRLALLLIGQAELRRRLSLTVHEAFSQRITVRHHLGGLTRADVLQAHHLSLPDVGQGAGRTNRGVAVELQLLAAAAHPPAQPGRAAGRKLRWNLYSNNTAASRDILSKRLESAMKKSKSTTGDFPIKPSGPCFTT